MELNSYNRPQRAEWQRLQQRGISDTSQVSDIVSRIISDVAERGDDAVLEMERRFGCPQLSDIRVSEAEFEAALKSGLGSFLGFIASTFINLLACVALSFFYFAELFGKL